MKKKRTIFISQEKFDNIELCDGIGGVGVYEIQKNKTKKIYEEVAEAIYEMIRTGQLKPGDKLDSVQQLAENFNVGRSAIREALSALKAMGLIEMRQEKEHMSGSLIRIN